MKPSRFRYYDPSTVAEAVALLGQHAGEAKVLAGGQSLMPAINLRVAHAPRLIDINRIAALDYIIAEDGHVRIGALVRYCRLERCEIVAAHCPLIRCALPQIGHVAIRNRGTIGGSLAQADPAAELPAVMLALGATIDAVSRRGTRRIPVAELYDGPLSTVLEPDELVSEIRVPAQSSLSGSAVVELARRHGDFALAGVAATLLLTSDGRMAQIRFVGFGVGPVPMRLARAESVAEGQPAEAAVLERAGLAARREIPGTVDIHASADYRKHVTAVLVRRALARAVEEARERQLRAGRGA